jgi:hypothetical protein
MKRLIIALGVALLLATMGPLPVVSAHNWWWHHHSGPSPAGVGADKNAKSSKTHREKPRRDKTPPLYTSPQSVGWWHKGPGPMGAGSGSSKGSNTQTARRAKHHKDKSAQLSSHHSFFSWWHHHDSSPQATGAGATASGK